jgi:hypothetical protein
MIYDYLLTKSTHYVLLHTQVIITKPILIALKSNKRGHLLNLTTFISQDHKNKPG